jgi:tRNA 5-methylaminomethyl-2-thiouridine biosynthesis bifunctional protein
MIEWRDGEPPRSRQFGDLYYSRDDGLAEARQVFLAGCGLPEAWRGRRRFCVAELGFGTGLNIAALLDLWAGEGPPDAHLTIFSIEAHPLRAGDAARALSAWPHIADAAGALTSRWPGTARGFHRIDLPQFRATLDLAVMDVADALAAWSGTADAWFLDGFAPALNPGMWTGEVLELAARRSAPGARLATYTVAGHVRRGLAAAGFAVELKPGFGAKRERLEARWPGSCAETPPSPRVAIVGAGIAGASLARAFKALGVEARVFDHGPPAAGFSALVAPRLDAGLGPPAALFAQALARARALYADVPHAIIARGALQLAVGPKDQRRFAAIALSDLFEPDDMGLLTAGESSARLGEAAPAGLLIATALTIDPEPALAAWSGHVTPGFVARMAHDGGAWRMLDAAGALIAEAEIVCLAAGLATAGLAPGLALQAVRGQASFAPGASPPATALFGGYVTPARGGVVFGATHDRDDESKAPRQEDHRRNLAALAAVLPALAARLAEKPLKAHVGVRATTSDYLPIGGPAPGAAPGLYVLTGLGSRGFTLAPLLAEHVAALALGVPSPLPAALTALIDPSRFARRALRRGRPAMAPEDPAP